MKKILLFMGAAIFCLSSYVHAADELQISAAPHFGTPALTGDCVFTYDESAAAGSEFTCLHFDNTATNCLNGQGGWSAFVGSESDPTALLTAGTDNVKDTHIDWGSGAGQVGYADVVALWTTCTGYLYSDGTCSTPSGGVDTSGTPEANDMARFTDADTIAGITYAEFFAIHDDSTWGAAAGTSKTWTFDTGAGTDPTMVISDDAFTYNKGLVALSFTTSGADGTHYVSALNTAALSSSATDGNLAFLTDRYFLGDGTDYNDYLLSKELVDTSAELYGILTDETGSAAGTPLSVYNQNPTIDDVTLGAAGVKITDDGDGAITLLGLGDGSDEDLTINLDDTANTVAISSSTGVTSISTGTIGIASTGPISGRLGEVIKTASATLTTSETNGQLITNYGETDDADLILTSHDIDTFPGNSFVYNIVTTMATNDTCFKAAADNLINFEGTNGADNGCVCNASPTLGNKLTCYALTTGASVADWYCEGTRGTWVAVADNTGDCPD
jgi:hypothetical protein